ncbi:MAG TPA: glutathione peroxidase [Candidatus Limnocylindria bacterium]|nr:glutathione peroxidase [Candidatus Limnocylindria bacterium]
MSVYEFTVKGIGGEDVSLEQYSGKVLLVVNTATECGFTPQDEGLQERYEKYRDQGFEILDFPCDQFGGEAPGTSEEIHAACVGRFGIAFPQFAKVEVNGENADPLFEYLRRELPGIQGSDIKWNFTKFLIDRTGKPVRRFAPQTEPAALHGDVEELLAYQPPEEAYKSPEDV